MRTNSRPAGGKEPQPSRCGPACAAPARQGCNGASIGLARLLRRMLKSTPGFRTARGRTEPMLPVAEAQRLVLQHARPLPPQTVPLTPPVQGLILAEDVTSDLDMPPYDKALMDGFAARAADLARGRAGVGGTEGGPAGPP